MPPEAKFTVGFVRALGVEEECYFQGFRTDLDGPLERGNSSSALKRQRRGLVDYRTCALLLSSKPFLTRA